MNTLRNKVSLIGRIGANPEVTTFENGNSLVRMTLATNESYKDHEGNWKDNVQWHTINAWGKLAERIKNSSLEKGQELIIEGRLVNQSYQTKDGQKRYQTVIEANEYLILSK